MTSTPEAAGAIDAAKRIVIKIGSSLLIDSTHSTLRTQWLESLIQDAVDLHRQGKDVLIVSSGSIGLGRGVLDLKGTALTLPQKQAASSVGQIQLTHAYHEALSAHDIVAAQILLTLDDSENRRRYINARDTMTTLLDKRAIPVINENDTVATSEIRVGDNDRLAARVAVMTGADLLILLSDVNGLYDANPAHDPDAKLISSVEQITDDFLSLAGDAGTDVGTGGMVTKLKAGIIANDSGCNMIIASGLKEHPIRALQNGGPHTIFHTRYTPRSAFKEWIATGLSSQGVLVIDDGAAQALNNGKSLLPTGITEVKQVFSRGDVVTIQNKDRQIIARGLSAHNSDLLSKIIGLSSQDIKQKLGQAFSDNIRVEAVHRDNMVLDTNWKLLRDKMKEQDQ